MGVEAILTSVSIGLVSAASPCILPLYPGFLAYLAGVQESVGASQRRYLLGFFVLAGVLLMMLVLGAAIALIAIPVGRALSVLIPLADLLIATLGVALLLDVNPFEKLPQVRVPLVSNPYANAFLYGLLYGPIALPCAGPLVVGIFAFSLTAAEAVDKLSIFAWFGLGFGLPLLGLSFLSGASQRWITRLFARHARLFNVVAGLLLLGIAFYDLWTNWDLVVAFWQ